MPDKKKFNPEGARCDYETVLKQDTEKALKERIEELEAVISKLQATSEKGWPEYWKKKSDTEKYWQSLTVREIENIVKQDYYTKISQQDG